MALRGKKGDANFTITATDQTAAALKSARRNLNKTAKGMRTMGKVAGGVATAGTVLLSKNLLSLTKRSSEAARELQTLAQVSGILPSKLQEQAFATRRVGIQHDKLADIYKDMQDRVGDFIQTGGGPMVDFFEKVAPKVGVTAKEFQNLSGPDALQLFATSLEEANLSQSEMIFQMEAMSSESSRLLPLLRNNGEALAEQAQKARELGIVVSDLDIEKLTMLAGDFGQASAMWDSYTKKLSAELAPAISAIIDYFETLIIQAGGLDEIASLAANNITKGFMFVADAVDGAIRTFKVLGEAGHITFDFLEAGLWEVAHAILNGPVDITNEFIGLLNRIPGFPDIDEFGMSGLGAQAQKNMNDAYQRVEDGKARIQEILMEPMASETFKPILEDAKNAMDKAAAAAAAARDRNGGGGSGMSDDDQEGRNKVLRGIAEENQARMELMRQRYFGEEMIRNEYQERLDMMEEERRNNDLISTRQFNQAKLNELRAYMDDQYGVQTSGYDALTNMVGKNWNVQSAMVADAFGSIINTMSTESRKAFEIQKALSLANAAINAYEAITGAYKFGANVGGPVLGAAMAAAAGAAQFAQISKIAKQSFNGGASKSSGGGGGGGVATSGSTASGSSVAVDNQRREREEFGGAQVTVNVPADELTNTNTMRNMLERLDEIAQDTPLRNIRVQSA